jgi:large subunit ribosomal protein L27Ae
MAGGQHHHRVLMDRFHPGYFGKVGMRHFHLQRNRTFTPTINVDRLLHLAGGAAAVKQAQDAKKAGKGLLVDVTKSGVFKVLGKGRLPALPLVVKARYVSKGAESKIKAAGGAVVLTA